MSPARPIRRIHEPLHGFGVLSRAEALRLGALGVAARASGLHDDLRRDRPRRLHGHHGSPDRRLHGTWPPGSTSGQEAAVSAALIADLARRIPRGQRAWTGPLSSCRNSCPCGAEGPRGLMAVADGRPQRHRRSAPSPFRVVRQLAVLSSVVPGNLVPDFRSSTRL